MGLKCMLRIGLSQISFLSYLPQKPCWHNQRCNCVTAEDDLHLLLRPHSPFHQPCVLALSCVLALLFAGPHSEPVQRARLAENASTSPKRMTISAGTAPLHWLTVGKGCPAVLLWFCSPWEHESSLTNCHEATAQPIAETRGKSELLKPFLLPNALVQTTGFMFSDYCTVCN